MPDEAISNAELARRLEHLGGDLHDDLKDLKATIDKLVPREVYEAKHTALEKRVEVLETRARWLIGVIIVPVAMFVLQWFLAAKGVKP